MPHTLHCCPHRWRMPSLTTRWQQLTAKPLSHSKYGKYSAQNICKETSTDLPQKHSAWQFYLSPPSMLSTYKMSYPSHEASPHFGWHSFTIPCGGGAGLACISKKPGAEFTKYLTISRKIIIKFIVKSSYDSDLWCANISLRDIIGQFTNTISDDLTILQVYRTQEKPCTLHKMLCKLDIRRKTVVTLSLS